MQALESSFLQKPASRIERTFTENPASHPAAAVVALKTVHYTIFRHARSIADRAIAGRDRLYMLTCFSSCLATPIFLRASVAGHSGPSSLVENLTKRNESFH